MKNVTKRLLAGIVAAGTLLTVVPVFAEVGGEITKSVASETDNNEAIKAEYAEELALLSGLGILSDTNIKMNNSITRGEFLTLVMKMIKMDDLDTASEETVFYDVLPGSDYYDVVMSANQLGLVNGDDQGCFNPDKAIDSAAAVKILVCALDFGFVGEAKGGYPMGYISVARDLEIIDNVSVYGTLMWKDAIDMIYNGIHSRAAEKSYNADGNVTAVTGEETVLKKYYDVVRCRGIVEETNLTLRMQGNEETETRLQISGELYNKLSITQSEGNDLLGKAVVYYIKEETDEIIAVSEDTKYNTTTVIDPEDIQSANFGRITYWNENDKEVKVEIDSDDAKFYYNGTRSYDMTLADLKPENGTVTLIDNNRDKKADVVIIKDWYDMALSKASTLNLSSLYNDGKDIDLKETDMVLYKDGFEITTFYIDAYQVARVMLSKDKKNGIAEISGYELSGKVEGIKEKDGKNYITIAGKEYEMSKVFVDAYTRGDPTAITPKKGNIYRFILDNDDVVFGIRQTTTNQFEYGYMIRVVRNGGLESSCKAKIYGSQGSMITCDVAENVKVNGKKVDDFFDAVTYGTGVYQDQLVMYKFNEKKELSEVLLRKDITNSAEKYDRENFSLDKVGVIHEYQGNTAYWSGNGNTHVIENELTVNDGKSPLFYIPYDLSAEDDYRWMTVYGSETSFSSTATTMEIYDLVPIDERFNECIIGAVVVKQTEAAAKSAGAYDAMSLNTYGHGTEYFVINEVREELDGNGELRITLDAWSIGGTKITMYCHTDAQNLDNLNTFGYGSLTIAELKHGDIISASYDNSSRANPLIDRFMVFGKAEKYLDENYFASLHNAEYKNGIASRSYIYAEILYQDENLIIYHTRDAEGADAVRSVSKSTTVWDYSERSKEIVKSTASNIAAGDRIFLQGNENTVGGAGFLIRVVE